MMMLKNTDELKALDMITSHYKVLIVDDEESIKKLIVTLLSRKGHQCVTASNGLEALDRIKENSFDAVVTDIIMPEMDGIALTKALLKHNQNLPIMIMTGHTDQYSAEIAIGLGAREFVSKPFSVEEFILRFHKMMYDHKVLREIEAKKNNVIFNSQKESMEKISELEREIDHLKGRLSSKYLDY
jgi:two-component system response regulator ResD